jgi:hypothetical protein
LFIASIRYLTFVHEAPTKMFFLHSEDICIRCSTSKGSMHPYLTFDHQACHLKTEQIKDIAVANPYYMTESNLVNPQGCFLLGAYLLSCLNFMVGNKEKHCIIMSYFH